MVLVVKGGIARRPMHHARRLSVHHVSHRRVRTVSPTWTCGQWWKDYTLLRLELCPTIGKGSLYMLAKHFNLSHLQIYIYVIHMIEREKKSLEAVFVCVVCTRV